MTTMRRPDSSPRPPTPWGSHLRIIALILVFAVVICATALGYMSWRSNVHLTWEERWSLFCWSILLSWWVVYFNHRRLGVTNLRAFLDNKNPFRRNADQPERQDDESAQTQNQQRIIAKSSSSISAQGVEIAIVALLLNHVLAIAPSTRYLAFVRPWVVALAMVTILLLCFAIDILDTSANIFDPGSRSERQYRQWFFRHVGPFAPKGGVTYAYYGFAGLSVFFVVALSYLYVPLSGFGVAVYIYLGYPYLYGYRRTPQSVEIDEGSALPGLLFSLAIGLVTAALHF